MSLKAAFLFFALSTAALADTQSIDVFTEHMPPYQVISEEHYSGFAVELVAEFVALAGMKANIIPINWARGYRLAKTEPNALLMSVVRNPERENDFRWLAHIDSGTDSLWALTECKENCQLSNKVAVVRGDSQEQLLLPYQEKGEVEIVSVSSKKQAIQMLVKKRVDYIVASEPILMWRLKQLAIDPKKLFKVRDYSERKNNLYIVASKAMPDADYKKLEQAWQAMQHKQAFHELRQKWLLPGDRLVSVK